ncbi:HlyD family efflux transporter periplasmic adaptor subunit [Grimontia sp. NTOU-MAR1]|uniref:HlyD family efflux transporter periplasmic adaptor subunit n=1 Tax=Grimontia sp. NTOU-MAR1 TaxID=3111011 RepID=UPI002DBB68A0|nr:HlyD family efflux transporter periplasmic adaptor subunit [Grimontia sp. NTOU-MAR1]WRV98796.1 HlyD family efflux transporter periplasmic adaptor subunit [Grimontia sp. NTOU-MAR1]
MSQLYRQSVIDAQKQRLHGDVLLTQPLSISLIVAILFISLSLLVLFLNYAEYSRKETVQGYILPDRGIIKSFSQRKGIVETVHIMEGQEVEKGQPLVTIISRSKLENGLDLNQTIVKEFEKQYQYINKEIEYQNTLHVQQMEKQNLLVSDIERQLSAIESQQSLINEKYQLQLEREAQHLKLHREGHLSALDLQSQKETLIEIKAQKERVIANELDLRKARNTLQSDLTILPKQHQLNVLELEQQKSSIRQQLSQAQGNAIHVLTANEKGKATGINVVTGETVQDNDLLLSLIPENAKLIAELFLPTRSAGFVKKEDLVKLRLEAFPYQRFGYLSGKVSHIGTVLLQQGESPLPINEPVYRIRVSLDKEHIDFKGSTIPLKNGMLLEADILLESRSIMGWILEPVYGLLGKI